MRLISQNKIVDIDYGGAVVYINRNAGDKIYIFAHVPDEEFSLGAYDTFEDAVFVMSLIRTTLMCNHRFFYMPEAEEVPVMRANRKEGEKE